jgi:hypothetical protein
MKTTPAHDWNCWAAASLFDPELVAMYAVLLIVLVCGGIAIHAAYRWYRNLKQPSLTSSEDLAQFARTLQEQGDLDPEELKSVRAALERHKPFGGDDG